VPRSSDHRGALSDRRRDDLSVLIRFGAAAAAAEVIGTLVAANDTGVDAPPWLVGVACAVGVLIVGAGVLASHGYRAPPGRLHRSFHRTRTDRESGGLRRVERLIDNGFRDTDRFNLRVRPWLLELAEQRLRHRSAVDLQHDPDTARTLLGESLWQLTQQPAATAPTRPELADWIARLEAL
jgi:hypothetical protein